MARPTGITVIKKYANRRLYNTATSSYVTLDDLAKMVRKQEEFSVLDARTGGDITQTVLTQIVFEQETDGGHAMLSPAFLRRLIACYGDRSQAIAGDFLDHAMQAFTEKRSQLAERAANGATASIGVIEEEARRTAESFHPAFRAARHDRRRSDNRDIEDLRAQFRTLQERLDRL
ncbi:polyhydroxyalkanoate synthesis repressor PhaR [Rhizobiaceae bacterium BDR2-2]|uniref:Polyhydroxyalkanoate synthesis repressor PhaR n=1 Tax=Ectorhizobium quercum TaxID=2965071 RepID=A0AAE3SX04_9HYPH|nr:polyhydroxyalkanoate synthesis repressor PhaR [Ectorhizobium quercum]MCX8999263.1 polyhydroxyalkanoate synthesis repressor PhaR [Ectorhizobium quercum]